MLIFYIAWQLWKTFNTIDAGCPNCESPVTVLKNGEATICLNCGSVVRANIDQDGVELCNAEPSFEESPSFGGLGSLFDGLSTPNSSIQTSNDKTKNSKRDNTIIDIDFTED